jgi:hypothetical protein
VSMRESRNRHLALNGFTFHVARLAVVLRERSPPLIWRVLDNGSKTIREV